MSERSPYKKIPFDSKKIFFNSLSGALAVIALSVFYYYVISKPRLDEHKMNIERLVQENKLLELKNAEKELQFSKQKDKVENKSLNAPEMAEMVKANEIEKNIDSMPSTTKEPGSIIVPLTKTTDKKNETKEIQNDTSEKNRLSIYEERRLRGLEQFENEIDSLVKSEIKDLENRWDQFVNACLINSDSKKYLFGRKWFQFYEDLISEAPDISLVYKLKYYENPTCISYETEIVNLIRTIKSKLFMAEKRAANDGVYSADINSIKNRYFIERREWKDLEIKPILKQRDLRDIH